MSKIIYEEVDAGKEQPTENKNYICLPMAMRLEFRNGNWYNSGHLVHTKVTHWLRPIQQQEGLAIEFAEWIGKKSLQQYMRHNVYLWKSEGQYFTTSELFNQFINSIKR